MIADANPRNCEALTAFLTRHEDLEVVGVVHDGAAVVALVQETQPDVLLLDLILPQLDGIAVLEELHRRGYRGRVFVLTALAQESYVRWALDLGADYYLLKPYDPQVLLARLRRPSTNPTGAPAGVSERQMDARQDIAHRTARILRDVGIPTSIRGYRYLQDGIQLVLENPHVAMTKELYPAVARRYGTTPSRVERAIRHAIEVSCTRGNIDLLSGFFGSTIGRHQGKPTNKQFLTAMADALQLEQGVG